MDEPKKYSIGSEYMLAAGKALAAPSFIERHGSEPACLIPFLDERTDPEVYRKAVEAAGKAANTPRKRALQKSAGVLIDTAWGEEVAPSHDVFQLCHLIGLCLGTIQNTKANAVEAFAEAFSLAWQSVVNSERARNQHAPKKAILAEAWEHFKKAHYSSLAEGARACANHYRGDEMPTERAFLDHFRAQAKAEGMTFKAGRKPKPKVAKKPLKRAA
ncbi:MAG: hypothetical protein ROZ64_15830 [Burkholderiaceae bacterium]|jgi:hypothetical protein|nr:hypothetical protein [Burkholderiaceae bacterium]